MASNLLAMRRTSSLSNRAALWLAATIMAVMAAILYGAPLYSLVDSLTAHAARPGDPIVEEWLALFAVPPAALLAAWLVAWRRGARPAVAALAVAVTALVSTIAIIATLFVWIVWLLVSTPWSY